MKRIVSVFLPHWSIERRECKAIAADKPIERPAEAPFALVESSHRGIRLSAMNASASALGLSLGDGLSDARAIYPGLIVAPANPLADRQGARALAHWLGRYGIQRNAYGLIDETPSGHRVRSYGAWIDITGVAHLYGGEQALVADIEIRLARMGVTASVGVADTLGAAHALGWHSPRSMIAPPSQTREAIAHLPVSALRLDRSRVHLLHRLGIKRIGDLASIPRLALERRFRSKEEGERVLNRLDQALGLKDEPRRSIEDPPDLRVSQPYAEPLISSEALENEIKALIERFCTRLDTFDLGVMATKLSFYRCDGTVGDITISLSQPTRSPPHLTQLMGEKLGALDLGYGVDLLTLDALATRTLIHDQKCLNRSAAETKTRLIPQLVDRLTNRLGSPQVTILEPRSSHWPERSQVRSPASSIDSLKPIQPTWASTVKATRPALVFKAPEPIDVMAEIPEGAPVRFTWRRVPYGVVRASGPERIEPEWWRQTGSSPPARTRDYYALEDETGGRFWVFRDGRYDDESDAQPHWFIHGMFA